ncbi:MAG: hypothetical protein AAFQ94_18390 [Bacteroidota bacterium]
MWIVNVNDEQKQFLVIEPSFYDVLDPCDDFTIKCLEVIRRKLPNHFTQFPDGTIYGLICYKDFLGNKYPAIGIECKSNADYKKIYGFTELFDEVEILIDQVGIENIKKDAELVENIRWNRLKEIGWYFEK